MTDPLAGDLRALSEAEWLSRLGTLLAALPVRAELGPYWITWGSRDASLCCRLRGPGPLGHVACESWEASLCITGGDEGSWASVDAFPFAAGKRTTAEDDLWLMTWQGGAWTAPSPSHADGPGEWAYVEHPGDAFYAFALDVHAEGPRLTVKPSRGARPGPEPELFLASVRREGEPRELLPLSGVPPAPARRLRNTLALDVRDWEIAGNWQPGEYQVAVRASGLRRVRGESISLLSEPVRVVIVGGGA